MTGSHTHKWKRLDQQFPFTLKGHLPKFNFQLNYIHGKKHLNKEMSFNLATTQKINIRTKS